MKLSNLRWLSLCFNHYEFTILSRETLVLQLTNPDFFQQWKIERGPISATSVEIFFVSLFVIDVIS